MAGIRSNYERELQVKQPGQKHPERENTQKNQKGESEASSRARRPAYSKTLMSIAGT